MRRNKRTGEGQLGCILTGAILVVGLIIAWQAVPTKIRTAEFYDYIVTEAERAGSSEGPAIKKRIMRKADELRLPVDDRNLTVTKGGDRIRIKVKYTLTLEYPGYSYDWVVDHDVDQPIFYF